MTRKLVIDPKSNNHEESDKMATFWKTTIVFEVLSEGDESPSMDLLELVRETINGHMSGDVKSWEDQKVSRSEMRELLEAQRSDPEFLLGDDHEEEA